MKRVYWAAFAVMALSGCATVGDPRLAPLSAQIIDSALTGAPAQLQQAADQGNANAQFSYSIVLHYGLNGARQDADAAGAYRRLALASRGTTTSAIYVPSGKHSGHTQLISIPRYDITAGEAKSIDACVDTLSSRLRADLVTTQCGGPANYARLADLWAKARP